MAGGVLQLEIDERVKFEIIVWERDAAYNNCQSKVWNGNLEKQLHRIASLHSKQYGICQGNIIFTISYITIATTFPGGYYKLIWLKSWSFLRPPSPRKPRRRNPRARRWLSRRRPRRRRPERRLPRPPHLHPRPPLEFDDCLASPILPQLSQDQPIHSLGVSQKFFLFKQSFQRSRHLILLPVNTQTLCPLLIYRVTPLSL